MPEASGGCHVGKKPGYERQQHYRRGRGRRGRCAGQAAEIREKAGKKVSEYSDKAVVQVEMGKEKAATGIEQAASTLREKVAESSGITAEDTALPKHGWPSRPAVLGRPVDREANYRLEWRFAGTYNDAVNGNKSARAQRSFCEGSRGRSGWRRPAAVL